MSDKLSAKSAKVADKRKKNGKGPRRGGWPKIPKKHPKRRRKGVPPKPIGRAPYLRDETLARTIEFMVAASADQGSIAEIVGISIPTLKKYYGVELRNGLVKANTRMAGALFRNGTEKDNVIAQIFWLKTRGKWTERLIVQDAGDAEYDPSTLSDSEIEERLRRLRAGLAKREQEAKE